MTVPDEDRQGEFDRVCAPRGFHLLSSVGDDTAEPAACITCGRSVASSYPGGRADG